MAKEDNNKGRKKGLVKTIQDFMSSYQGKIILNYAYSWGAAVVIMGALFKLTHLPGGNVMLFIGMGTEVLVFAISAFDKPYKSYKWESVFPQIKLNGAPDVDLSGKASTAEAEDAEQVVHAAESPHLDSEELSAVINAAQVVAASATAAQAAPQQQQGTPSGVVVVEPAHPQAEGGVAQPSGTVSAGVHFVGGVIGNPVVAPGSNAAPQSAQPEVDAELTESITSAAGDYLDKLREMTDSLDKFQKATASLSEMSDSLAQAYKIISDNSGNITAHSQGYVYQMENLNRNLSGLNTIYEIQLRSISSQLDTIKQVNEGLERIKQMYDGSKEDSEKFHRETELMAKQIEELNAVYARMLQAMTVNMK